MSDLIRRESAIDAIKQATIHSEDESLAVEVLENLPSAEHKGKWIPCSEKLPDEDNLTGGGKQFSADVLMTVVNTIDDEIIIDYGHTTDGEWYSDTTDCYIPNGWKVLAWMPLPEAWRGEEE